MPGNPIADSNNFGGVGVDIFFVISGFIMWVTTEKTTQSTTDFWIRRIKRIVPLYWIFTTVIVVVGLAAPWALNSTKVTIPAAIKSYLFIPHYYSNDLLGSHIAPLLGPGWTLNYEMFFYFLFGLLLIPSLFRYRLYLATAILCGLVALGAALADKGPIAIVYTDQLLLEFLLGIYIGRTRSWLQLLPKVAGPALIVGGTMLLMILFYFADFPRIVMFGMPAAMLVTGLVSCETRLRQAPQRALLFLGDASYSLYLTHLFAIAPVLFLARRTSIPWAASSSLAVCSALLVGVTTYLFLEKPVTACLHRSRPTRSAATV